MNMMGIFGIVFILEIETAHLPSVEIGEGLHDLGLSIHHERSIVSNRLAEWLSRHDENFCNRAR